MPDSFYFYSLKVTLFVNCLTLVISLRRLNSNGLAADRTLQVRCFDRKIREIKESRRDTILDPRKFLGFYYASFMPVMNGLDAAKAITTVCPNSEIVLFTAHASKELTAEAKRVGIRAVLSKEGSDSMERLVSSLRQVRRTPTAA